MTTENGIVRVANDGMIEVNMIKVPKGWRLMRGGEITQSGTDYCISTSVKPTTDIDDWEAVSGIGNREVEWGGIESSGNYYCIRRDDKVKKKRAPKKQWLNPWD